MGVVVKKLVNINNRALKSLADVIEGKQGRFRQNLSRKEGLIILGDQ